MKKTNAARILDGLKVSYELREYEVDENDLSAINVANKVGFPIEQVFKTLVLRGDKTGVVVACIPGDAELDLKALAVVSSNKKVDMVNIKDLLQLTGYIRGGCSPVGLKKPYPVYLHESAKDFPFICISAGIRGCQILIAADDLLKAVKAYYCSITH